MLVASLGHETFFLRTAKKTSVLIDPLLLSSFGSDPERQFWISPTRYIDLERAPHINGIVLTSEHLQHFHPRSLVALLQTGAIAVGASVFVPELFPEAAFSILLKLGFRVERIAHGSEFNILDVKFKFYQSRADVLFWDVAVASLCAWDDSHSIFIQSDTVFPTNFASDVSAKKVPSPSIVSVTNNLRVSPRHSSVGFDNMLPVDDDRLAKLAGVRYLNDLLVKPLKKLPPVFTTLISGNGYKTYPERVAEIWSNEELAQIANELSIGTRVLALKPGQGINSVIGGVSENLNWVREGDGLQPNLNAPAPSFPAMSDLQSEEYLREIEIELSSMVKTWLITSYGQVLLALSEYLGRPTGTRRLALQFQTTSSHGFQFDLDISKARFERVSYEGDGAMRTKPFGVRMPLSDFISVLRGNIQIWEVMNLSASQWYVCNRYDSPLAFLLEFYGEQIDGGRTYLTYCSSLKGAGI